MSIFDGLTGALNAVFGAPVTITPPSGPPVTVTGQFRENPREVMGDDGRVMIIDTPTLQVRRPTPIALVKGAIVAPSIRSGETFRVLGVYRDRSPAADAYAVVAMEAV